jgi:hypothetical protein
VEIVKNPYRIRHCNLTLRPFRLVVVVHSPSTQVVDCLLPAAALSTAQNLFVGGENVESLRRL